MFKKTLFIALIFALAYSACDVNNPDGNWQFHTQCQDCHFICKACRGGTPDDCYKCHDGFDLKIPVGAPVHRKGLGKCVCKTEGQKPLPKSGGGVICGTPSADTCKVDGYFFDSAKTECAKCHPTCKTCEGSGEDKCLTCHNEQFTALNAAGKCKCKEANKIVNVDQCVDACPARTIVDTASDQTKFCAKCPPGSLTCEVSAQCAEGQTTCARYEPKTCVDQLTLLDAKCQCKKGEEFISEGENHINCQKCPDSCMSCEGHKCKTCKDNMVPSKANPSQCEKKMDGKKDGEDGESGKQDDALNNGQFITATLALLSIILLIA